MLQSMRERMQGIIAGAIVTLICITFALWGVQYYMRGGKGDNTVAKVNGVEITPNELRYEYERVRQQSMRESGGNINFDQEAQKELKQTVLNQMVKNLILSQGSQKLGLFISNRQLQAMVTHMPIFQVDGKFSPERFQELLSRMYYTENAFFANTRNSLVMSQLAIGVAGTAFVLPHEIDAAIAKEHQRRDIEYYLISKDKFSKGIKISESEINDYYKKHLDEFMVPESVSVEYVQLSADNLAKRSGAVPKEKLQQLFSEANDKLSEMAYTNSDSLEPVAKALNLDIKTTSVFTRDGGKNGIEKDPKFLKIAFSDAVLVQGYNSNPVEISPGNVVVMRLKQHFPAKAKELAVVRPLIEKELRDSAAQNKAKNIAETMLSDLKNGTPPAALAKKHNLSARTLIGLTRSDSKKSILTDAVFAAEKYGMTQFANGDYAVIIVKKTIDYDTKNITQGERDAMKKKLVAEFGDNDFKGLIDGWTKKAVINVQ
jgi:hypothetical protein